MTSFNYLRAWGFPEVFQDIDRLMDVHTNVRQREMRAVSRGMECCFDFFWEFECQGRTHRIAFEVKDSRELRVEEELRRLARIRAQYLAIRPVLLVPDEGNHDSRMLPPALARDVIVLPGREAMQFRADGTYSLVPIEVTRMYQCPHEVLEFEIRADKGRYDARRLISDFSPFAYDQVNVSIGGSARPMPLFAYLNRVALQGGKALQRGSVREVDVQLNAPIRLIGPADETLVSKLHVKYVNGKWIKSIVRISPVAMALSRVANEEVRRQRRQ